MLPYPQAGVPNSGRDARDHPKTPKRTQEADADKSDDLTSGAAIPVTTEGEGGGGAPGPGKLQRGKGKVITGRGLTGGSMVVGLTRPGSDPGEARTVIGRLNLQLP